MGIVIKGNDRVIQQRFFSRMLVLIRGDFHKEAVTDSARVPPNEKPLNYHKHDIITHNSHYSALLAINTHQYTQFYNHHEAA